jgi:hypothetical protein
MNVWRTLGREKCSTVLKQSLPECGGEVATMLHNYAAAQVLVQGTFREPSANFQGTLREQSD